MIQLNMYQENQDVSIRLGFQGLMMFYMYHWRLELFEPLILLDFMNCFPLSD